MVVGYACAFSEDSLRTELDALERAGCTRVLSDKGEAALFARPGFLTSLSQLAAGDTLVVCKLSRLGRTLRQFVSLMEDLRRQGIEFCSLGDGIDTRTAVGQAYFRTIAALAQVGRDRARERAGPGHSPGRARGRNGGRPPKLSSSQLAQARLRLSDPETTLTRVAADLNVARSTLYRALLAEVGPKRRRRSNKARRFEAPQSTRRISA